MGSPAESRFVERVNELEVLLEDTQAESAVLSDEAAQVSVCFSPTASAVVCGEKTTLTCACGSGQRREELERMGRRAVEAEGRTDLLEQELQQLMQ
eukprot:3859243-Rhodomonas_salina.1